MYDFKYMIEDNVVDMSMSETKVFLDTYLFLIRSVIRDPEKLNESMFDNLRDEINENLSRIMDTKIGDKIILLFDPINICMKYHKEIHNYLHT